MRDLQCHRKSLHSILLVLLCICFSTDPIGASDFVTPKIRRDSYGIPHILAATEESAAYALGYAQAEDHCVAIARAYVSARGEEAKYFGTGIENDFLIKFYEVARESERDLSRISREYRKWVSAYVRGFNRYVDLHRSELPAWIPLFSAADVMAHRRAGAVRQVHSPEAVRQLRKKYPTPRGEPEKQGPEIVTLAVPPAAGDWVDEEAGSNAFALAGTRTVSGVPILLGNPHLNWNSLYWEAQITVPGKVNFFGSTLAGIPVLRAGFNGRLGWVTTNNSPDTTDIFALTLDPGKPDHYKFYGQSRPLVRREVSIEVRDSGGGLKRLSRVYWESHLGRIIYRDKDHAFAVKSTLIDACRYYEGFNLLTKAKNLKEFRSSLSRGYIPTSNFTYADADGNILYQWNARVPRRPADGTDYSLDIPAEDSRHVSDKVHRLAELPHLLNPAGGYIQNCNNPPWYTTLRAPIDPKKFPAYLEKEAELALRPQVALGMLDGAQKFSMDEVKRLKFNDHMLLADRVKPSLMEALRARKNPSEDIREGWSVLESWDNTVEAASRGGVLFQRFWDQYIAALPQPYQTPWDPVDPMQTPKGLADPALAVSIFETAAASVRKDYGGLGVAWGEVHRFRFPGIDLPGDGASGTYGLFRVVRFQPSEGSLRVAGLIKPGDPPVGFGDAWVLAVEFTKPVTAYSILAYGQTTSADSPHARDQIRLFSRGEYKRIWFEEDEIRAYTEREYEP